MLRGFLSDCVSDVSCLDVFSFFGESEEGARAASALLFLLPRAHDVGKSHFPQEGRPVMRDDHVFSDESVCFKLVQRVNQIVVRRFFPRFGCQSGSQEICADCLCFLA